MLIYKKDWNEDLGNYSSVNLTLVPWKVMEQIMLSAITFHVQDKQAGDQVLSVCVYERQVLPD